MEIITAPLKKEQSNGSSYENQKGIETHKKAAAHFEAAAKYHRDAARFHEEGNHGKAAQSTVAAQGHQILGTEAQREDLTHHALNG